MSRPSEYTYTPAWWVPGAHLRTLWGKLARRSLPLETRVERWPTPDGDELELRRVAPLRDAPDRAGRQPPPRLLVLHGLEGTIRSHYLAGTLAAATRRGWAADALIFRTCNGEVTRARRLYHSGETTDLDFVVRRLQDEHPEQALVLAGFSLGGNVLLKWLGEQGDSAPANVRGPLRCRYPSTSNEGRGSSNEASPAYTLATSCDRCAPRLTPSSPRSRGCSTGGRSSAPGRCSTSTTP